ncbi:hypothetical protein [Algoriphagus formosus]|uniref:hypothetical protein n=1 Tax=Algoriphagus formosus TaxID=2007308 RepID=UPI000C2959B0|nr:hypothetical protein [Algoriphagus formosus]
MKYYKDQLEYLGNPYLTDMDEIKRVISNLMERLNQDCSSLSIAEKDWICSKIQILHNEKDELLDPYDFPCCDESIFYDRYLWYFNNLEGFYPVRIWKGEVTGHDKERDIQMLERHHQSWKAIILNNSHSDSLLNNISTETRHQLREIERYCRKAFLGANKRKALEKELILHSKFVFRYVQAFYEENAPHWTMVVDGKNILIDSFSYVHTLLRHFGKSLKEHQDDKSYHVEGLDYKNLPLEFGRIISAYSKISSGHFDEQKIFFKMNGKIYAIWFREFKSNIRGGRVLSEFRVQTFYPVEDPKELKRINNDYTKEVESNGLIFFLK